MPRIIFEGFSKQQYSVNLLYHLLIQNKNIKLILNYSCGPLVFCILLISINHQLHQQANLPSSLLKIHSSFSDGILQLLLVFCLMFLNWGIEAKKWQVAMKIVAPVSFGRSLKAIFSGNTLAFFTPNRTGEYLGRMLYLEKGSRVSSVPLTLVCSIAQVMVTLFTGILGLLFLENRIVNFFGENTSIKAWLHIILWLSVVLLIVLTIFYLRLPSAIRWISGKKWMLRWSRHLRVLEDVNATILFAILSLSATRYLVFIVQYYLLFGVFGVGVDWWQAFWAVSIVFFVIAVIPALGFLSELGIRWQAGIQVMQLFSSNITGIFATSLAIWIINLAIPALVGGVLILALKLFRK
jgi:hypothetical protein